MMIFYRTLIQIDAAQAATLAAGLPDEHKLPITRAMAATSPPQAMGAIARLLVAIPRSDYTSCSSDDLNDALDEWSVAEPVQAARLIESRPDELSNYCATIIGNWAAVDPMKSKAWLDQQYRAGGDENVGSAAYTDWLNGFFQCDEPSAIDYAVNNQADPLLVDGIRSIANTIYREQPDGVENFVDQLHGSARAAALAGVVSGFTNSDNTPSTSTEAFQPLADWLWQFDLEESEDAISSLMSDWKRRNHPELLRWLRELPSDVQLRIAAQYPGWGATITPEEMNQIVALGDLPVRDEVLKVVMTHAQYQREETLAALEQSHLTAGQKAHFASLIPPQASDETP
jgi:hypothetical protein